MNRQLQGTISSGPANPYRPSPSDDSEILWRLVCFLGDAPISIPLLHYGGGASERRWYDDGSIRWYDVPNNSCYKPILVDKERLQETVEQLKERGVLSKNENANGTYSMSTDSRKKILESLDPAESLFWQREALYVVSNAIAPKYLGRQYVSIRTFSEKHVNDC
jgi:hypothetical protein